LKHLKKNLKKNPKIAYVDSFLKGIVEICNNISQPDIDQLVETLFNAWRDQNNIFIVGNGGSAGTAMHLSGDLNNCTANFEGLPPVRAFSLAENIVRFSALVNDRGWNNVYTEQLKNYFRPGDIVIAISVHGGSGKDKAEPWSQNLTSALQYAKDNGGKTIGLTGFDGGAFKDMCDLCVIVPYNTTPHVEAFHVVIHHLVFDQLTKRIEEVSHLYKK